jgi:hypothetical protein
MSGEPAERRGYAALRGQRIVLPDPGEGGAVEFVRWLPEPLSSLYDDDRRRAGAGALVLLHKSYGLSF